MQSKRKRVLFSLGMLFLCVCSPVTVHARAGGASGGSSEAVDLVLEAARIIRLLAAGEVPILSEVLLHLEAFF